MERREISTTDLTPNSKPKFRARGGIPLRRVLRQKDSSPVAMIAYDLETTRIAAGTPRPLYITAYGENPAMRYEERIRSMDHLRLILINYFLIEEYNGIKFVAWNGNNFDVYFIAACLVRDERFILRPYLTRSNAVRGLRITLAEFADQKGGPSWEFLDGIAMLGLVQTPLYAFLSKFAPDFGKLKANINFEFEEFDYKNIKHREYAFRDSEGLYHGMIEAQRIMLEKFNQPLAVTMGGACIKIFKSNIPSDVTIYAAQVSLMSVIRDYVMRGGYCYCVKRYQGPVWKYDLNQAYAAAMREAKLPHGAAFHSSHGLHPFATIYVARITARNAANKIPFYYRGASGGGVRGLFATTEICDTWLTSIEIKQLRAEGWEMTVYESYAWEDTFDMRDYVNKLEAGRMAAEGGPNGPLGTMFKNVGNHSYGKTVEQLEPIEYCLAPECPPGWIAYYGDENKPLDHVFYRFVEEQRSKDYHQPQIGSFITAHVRMVVRRAALLAPESWLYADTDCVVFSADVTSRLDIDAKRYGAWKIEEDGAEYRITAKKVYDEVPDFESGPIELTKLSRSAKGMNAKKLTIEDFENWHNGEPPIQQQVQRQNFLLVMNGGEMYKDQQRSGTRIKEN